MRSSGGRVRREAHPQRRLVIYPTRVRATVLCVVALLVVGGGAALLALGEIMLQVLGAAVVAFFGYAALYFAYRIARPAPSLTVDAFGIHDNASAVGVGFVPWQEIKDCCRLDFRGQPMLAVIVDDPDAVIARAKPFRRAVLRVNTKMMGTPVNVPGAGLPFSVDELTREISAYRPQ